MKAHLIHRILTGITAFGLVLLIASPQVFAQKADSEQINDLLTKAKTYALRAADDSATLESFTRSSMDFRSHAVKLNQIKENFNEVGKLAKQMSDASSEGSAWQQEAVREIYPVLQSMADNLTSCIEHLNKNQSQVNMPSYQDYVHANYEYASRTSEMINDFVDYQKAKARSLDLEQKLELPGGSQK